MPDQRLVEDRLTVATRRRRSHPVTGLQQDRPPHLDGWRGQLRRSQYHAVVDVAREPVDLSRLKAVPMRRLPGRVVHFLWPSRYVQSDALKEFAVDQFGEPERTAP